MTDREHRQGCPATGGYGHGVERCSCGVSWADPSTLRGKIELLIEPIISGGARQEDIDEVVDTLMALIEQEDVDEGGL